MATGELAFSSENSTAYVVAPSPQNIGSGRSLDSGNDNESDKDDNLSDQDINSSPEAVRVRSSYNDGVHGLNSFSRERSVLAHQPRLL
jgi:hypothetical protein